jgi:putative nucleotidyltransferase with HDIG domain
MTRDSFLPRRGAIYVAFVIIVGFAVIGLSAYSLAAGMLTKGWITLAALTLLSGSATVKLPSVPATISISETFVFTSVLLYGAPAGATIVALDGLIISVWLANRRKEFYRVAFNMAAPALSIWIAATFYYAFPGIHPLVSSTAVDIDKLLFPLLVFTLCHFLVNSWLIAFAVAFETGRRPFNIWRTDFLWLSLNYFGGASLAALLVVYTRQVNFTYIGIIVPLLLVLYFTFKIPMARVEDTNLHLKKVNSLYLSTIETLALAIDAKDQVTHGHIRRVQTHTVALARALGMHDDLMLKAIEASALLHDMGKLAIPEHILNKPGKLTPAEFDKMKLHASIGADILSSIEFPYPVVPIVRHHHENWDGTGYPSGLSGTAIPLGARILSVVDCFDALTSDRPYRPALSTEASLKILMDRRGNMYDPMVVDTFVRLHRELTEGTEQGHQDRDERLTRQDRNLQVASQPRPPTTEDGLSLFLLYQVLTDFSDHGWNHAADLVVYRLSQLVPVSRCAVFSYDRSTDSLVCQSTHGPGLSALRGSRRAIGEGLSGWVAANRRAVINSIPALDLAELCPEAAAELNSTLSVPLVLRGDLVGVLTTYGTSEQAFSEHHKQILESIGPHVAGLLERSGTSATAPDTALARYPGASHLDHYIRQRLASRDLQNLSLVVFKVEPATQNMGDASLTQRVADFAMENMRGGDLVFVCGAGTVVCLLADADSGAAVSVQQRLLRFPTAVASRLGMSVSIRSAIVSAPRDGHTLAELLSFGETSFAMSRSGGTAG